MHKDLHINKLDRIAIVGVGLLGGSIGLALRAAGWTGRRVGIGRRMSSLERALKCDAVDEVTCDMAEGVTGAQLVILCTPIGRLGPLIDTMAGALAPGTYVTDVSSTKAEVVRLAERGLPKAVRFVGCHPMAGSEKTGVEYARADLFDSALCIVTPTRRTAQGTVRWMCGFWSLLGCQTIVISPRRHDALLARVSHLPHAVATALVRMALADSAIDLAGPGFADTTRIASGDPTLWTDIFRTNRKAMLQSIDRLIRELQRFRNHLDTDDEKAIGRWLTSGKESRDEWIAQRFRKKAFPS